MNGLCQKLKLDDAFKVLTEMKERNLVPDFVIYKTLIEANRKEGNSYLAQKLEQEMKGQGCDPNLVNYSQLIDIYCTEGRLQKACDLYSCIKLAGFTADRVACNTLIIFLCKEHQSSGEKKYLKMAESIFFDMEKAGYVIRKHSLSSFSLQSKSLWRKVSVLSW